MRVLLVSVTVLAACTGGAPAAVIELGGPYDFGLVEAGTRSHLQVKGWNRGGRPLTISSIATDDDAFLVHPKYSMPVPAGNAFAFQVTFDSKNRLLAEYTATLTVKAGGAEATATLTAVSAFMDCKALTDADFAAVVIGETGRLRAPIVNRAAVARFVTIAALQGTGASVFGGAPAPGAMLEPGQSLDVDLTFTPPQPESYLATFSYTFERCSPIAVSVRGQGVARLVDCRMPVHPPVPPGGAGAAEVVVLNWSTAPLQLSQLAVTPEPEFSISDAGAAPVVPPVRRALAGVLSELVPGELRIPLMFKPEALGDRHGALTAVTSLQSQPALSCMISGVGGGPDIDVSPLSLEIPADGGVGHLTLRNLAQVPEPDGTLELRRIAIAGLPGLTVSLPPVTVGPGVSVDVLLHATSAGDWQLSILSNDPDEPTVEISVHARP